MRFGSPKGLISSNNQYHKTTKTMFIRNEVINLTKEELEYLSSIKRYTACKNLIFFENGGNWFCQNSVEAINLLNKNGASRLPYIS